MLWILKISLWLMFSLSLISLGMVILPCTPTRMVYSAMCAVCLCVYMVFVHVRLCQGVSSGACCIVHATNEQTFL